MSDPKLPAGGNVRIRVVVALCMGHARCASVSPDVYVLDDEGYNRTAEKIVGAQARDDALAGARACPERVISVEEIS